MKNIFKNNLSRNEMRNVFGGMMQGEGGCMTKCSKKSDCTYSNCGICHYIKGQGDYCMTN